MVLTNSVDQTVRTDISQRIIGELGGRSTNAASLPPPAIVSRETLDRFVGEYIGRGGDVAKVVLEGKSLAVVLAGNKYPVRVVASDQIILEEAPPRAAGPQLFTA